MELGERLAAYVREFNLNDEECHPSYIPNEHALTFLSQEIPLIDLPDKTIERVYYFRWWTYRKHIRKTPLGYIISEFQPDVPWAGLYNSINCATPFHIREGRWLKNSRLYLRDYAVFFLNGYGQAFSYSMAFVNALWEYADVTGDFDFLTENYDSIKAWYDKRVSLSATKWGLYYSIDDRDGMEYSISGSGLRPTINSYIFADAVALSKIAKLKGNTTDEEYYSLFSAELKEKINSFLYDGEFYRTIPEGEEEAVICRGENVTPERNCKELVGYIPWMYGIADEDKTDAWANVFNSECFMAPYGITTADQSHTRFMEEHDHECLWNGPVWPFATSQTLVALGEMLKGKKTHITSRQYVELLHQYAACHKLTRDDGNVVDWIDENLNPYTGEWISRNILEELGFKKEQGGYERGKDYNHSLFCDLVLSGILGIKGVNGKLTVDPIIPEEWAYFAVKNLNFQGSIYDIYFDKTGSVYGKGKGLIVEKRVV